jgi:hypothetical protein
MGNAYAGYNDEDAQKPVINRPSSSSLISISWVIYGMLGIQKEGPEGFERKKLQEVDSV